DILEIGKEINPPGTRGGPMVFIPAGEFMMGCNEVEEGFWAEEILYYRVYLDAYYIDKYEVTVDQYAQCVKSGKCSDYHLTGWEMPPFPGFSETDGCNWGNSEKGNHPINCVDWNQASGYCKWAGKRLPTEAEWEKAARGTDGRKFPWGNQKATCNYAVMSEIDHPNDYVGCNEGSTWPVGSKPNGASPYGVMDMVGNVSEWVQDWDGKDYYKNSPTKNPPGPSSGDRRVTRGGNWMEYDQYLFTTFEHLFSSTPTTRGYQEGFRCVRDAK
ncbi:MAG: SUMF1/EgtB/PvdO family nonheme iron enzyme, partial [Proteobacteria bacterium]|nr:SUMF1/EgtB/PvdO family nonheme iron enzyme [Pseudomonadota bacterium]